MSYTQYKTFAKVLHKEFEDPEAPVIDLRANHPLQGVMVQYNPFGDFSRFVEFERNVSQYRKAIHLPWGLEQQAAIVSGLFQRIFTDNSDANKCIDTVHGYILHALLKGTGEGGPLVVTPDNVPYQDPILEDPMPATTRNKSPRSRGRRPRPGKPPHRGVYTRDVADTIQAFFMGEPMPHAFPTGEFTALTKAAQEVDLTDEEGLYIYDQEMEPVTDRHGNVEVTEGFITFGNWTLSIGTIAKGVPRHRAVPPVTDEGGVL